jgi:hypothetical protein
MKHFDFSLFTKGVSHGMGSTRISERRSGLLSYSGGFYGISLRTFEYPWAGLAACLDGQASFYLLFDVYCQLVFVHTHVFFILSH